MPEPHTRRLPAGLDGTAAYADRQICAEPLPHEAAAQILHALHPGVATVHPQLSKLGLHGEDAINCGQRKRGVQLRHLGAV
jgi:hypothetical protein